ncbi:hypothetical protein DPMN_038992 [Dreissena polymorpha]|uniref:Uncharacterized protein n=1 Tax=Dreissena polymorpha TaxID=45954 RepID=A0A9D4RNS3_DREPO|nr:hypothetical protein DPMN_038992 [Dreissena polymorpha]
MGDDKTEILFQSGLLLAFVSSSSIGRSGTGYIIGLTLLKLVTSSSFSPFNGMFALLFFVVFFTKIFHFSVLTSLPYARAFFRESLCALMEFTNGATNEVNCISESK